jgi:hypothetical protein
MTVNGFAVAGADMVAFLLPEAELGGARSERRRDKKKPAGQ